MNKLQEMSTFIVVAETLSIAGAAARLGTTKSVVSQRIKALEARLGVSLLERGARLSLTEAGGQFYPQCVRILADVAMIEEAIAPDTRPLCGTLRIATSHTFVCTHLAKILAEFALLHPELTLDVATDDRQVNMHQPDFDLAIRLGPIVDSELIARTLAPNNTFLCASPAYLERHGEPQHPDELRFHDGLLYTHRAPGGAWLLEGDGQRQTLRIKNRLRSDNAFQLLAAAKAGMGIMVLPVFLGIDALLSGELRIILPAWRPDGGNIVALYRKTHRASPRIQALVNFLCMQFGAELEWDRRLRESGMLSR